MLKERYENMNMISKENLFKVYIHWPGCDSMFCLKKYQNITSTSLTGFKIEGKGKMFHVLKAMKYSAL
jgi:hypothetical protein